MFFYKREQREIIGAYVNHLITRLIIILMIILDIIFVITAIALPDGKKFIKVYYFENYSFN